MIVFVKDGVAVDVEFLLAHDAFLTAAANLEDVAVIVVHGGAAPYLGSFTIATTEQDQGDCVEVVALVD